MKTHRILEIVVLVPLLFIVFSPVHAHAYADPGVVGRIYGKGRVWYAYHNAEEVTRVPLVIYDGRNTGIDDRLGETTDLTQTILEYFDIEERLSERARS